VGKVDTGEQARFEKARQAAEETRRRFEDHDPYTSQHSVRVAHWTVLIASNIPGFAQARLRRLEVTALLHDFGKTKIDGSILRKEGPLDKREWEAVKRHPDLGVEGLPVPAEFVVTDGIRWHHKHFDGSGYPDGAVSGFDIPLEARLIAVADVFDALTSERPYRKEPKAYPPVNAVSVLRDVAGTQLDPSLVSLFDSVYKSACEKVGGQAGQMTMQVLSVIGVEVQRARDLLRQEIGPFDSKDPLKGKRPDDRLVQTLVAGLVRASLDPGSAENISRYVLRLPLQETFRPSDMLGPPRKATVPPGGFLHHLEVILDLKRIPAEAAYLRVVVFMGQLWLSVGERSGSAFEIRLAR
jgi:hypothetical protein